MAMKLHKDHCTDCLPSARRSLQQSYSCVLYHCGKKICIRGWTRLLTRAGVGACLASRIFLHKKNMLCTPHSACCYVNASSSSDPQRRPREVHHLACKGSVATIELADSHDRSTDVIALFSLKSASTVLQWSIILNIRNHLKPLT